MVERAGAFCEGARGSENLGFRWIWNLGLGFGREADAPPTKILDFGTTRGESRFWAGPSNLMGPSDCGLDLHIDDDVGYNGSAQRALGWTMYRACANYLFIILL
jgi:hypothetical protein